MVGELVARAASNFSAVGFLGSANRDHGAESIYVSQFSLPQELSNTKFTLTVLEDGYYELSSSTADTRFKGKVGERLPLNFGVSGDYSIRVDKLLGSRYSVNLRSRQQEIESLQKRLKVEEQASKPGLIKAVLQGANPKEVAYVLNAIGQEYLQQNIERRVDDAENNAQALNALLPALKQEIDTADSEYKKLRNLRNSTDLSEGARVLLERAAASQAKLAQLKQDSLMLPMQFLPEDPRMQAAAAMLKQAQADFEGINLQINGLPLPQQDALRQALDMQVTTDLYASLLQTMQQLKLVKAGKVGQARLIDNANVPDRPIAPKRSKIVALAALLGLLLGMAAVLLQRAVRGAIDSVEQVEQITGLPVFASVPHSDDQYQFSAKVKDKRSADILAYTRSNDPAIESLRSFLTAMQFATLTARNNLILITAPTPEAGATFISVNFAAVLAASGKRVLLIDGDLRKGYLHRYFGLPQKGGFSEMVAGSLSQEEAIHKKVKPNMDFMSCGAFPPNPTELLRHANTADFFARAASLYDHIIVDAAPVLPVSDAAILAASAGSTVVVVREGFSTTDEIIEAQKRLGQAGVAITGLLVNDLVTHRARYRYGYAYSYGYGNGATESKKSSIWRRLFK